VARKETRKERDGIGGGERLYMYTGEKDAMGNLMRDGFDIDFISTT
jgi:hypothetical protein